MIENTRTERDFLGEIQIPTDKFYGIHTVRAKENFPITGYAIHKVLIQSLAMVKQAAAKANNDEDPRWEAIVSACQDVIEGRYHEYFIVDPIQGGAGTSINMNTNEVIANIALVRMGLAKGTYDRINPHNHVNKSQSTNDVVPTASNIAIRILLDELIATMESLHASFEAKAREFDHIVKIGRTHLQDAVPIRLGQEFNAYARVLKRDIERIKKTGNSLYEVNMGATAVGTALNTQIDYANSVITHLSKITSEFTGREFTIKRCENLVDGTQNVDGYTEVSAVLKICMTNMSKIANDMRLMVSGPTSGFGEISIPERQEGSSIMPGKVNPVMLELINQVSFQVTGNDQTISLAAGAGQFELNVMVPVLVFNLIQSISIMNNAFKVLKEFCIDGVHLTERNLTNMARYVNECAGVATALTPDIGHHVASQIAREALEQKTSVLEVTMQTDIHEKLGLSPKNAARLKVLQERGRDYVQQILDPDEMTRMGEKLS